MPRPAPRVAPATSATRPVSGLEEDLVLFIAVSCVATKLNVCLPRAAVRNLANLQNDLADPALRRHLLRLA
jgi:hypothetical protein